MFKSYSLPLLVAAWLTDGPLTTQLLRCQAVAPVAAVAAPQRPRDCDCDGRAVATMAHSPHQDGRTAVISMVALGPRQPRPRSCVAGRRSACCAVPRWPGSRSPRSHHHDRHGRAVATMAQSPRQGGRTTAIAMDRDGSRWPMARQAHDHEHHDGRAVAQLAART